MQAMTQPEGGQARGKTEDQFTKTVEDYTAAVPLSAYLTVAIGVMGLSLLCQMTGRGWKVTTSPIVARGSLKSSPAA